MSEHVCACECIHAHVCVCLCSCMPVQGVGIQVPVCLEGLQEGWYLCGGPGFRSRGCGCSWDVQGREMDHSTTTHQSLLQLWCSSPGGFLLPHSLNLWDPQPQLGIPKKGHTESRSASFHLRLAERLRILTACVIPVQVGVEVTLGLEMQGSQSWVNLETGWSLSSSHSQSSMRGPYSGSWDQWRDS